MLSIISHLVFFFCFVFVFVFFVCVCVCRPEDLRGPFERFGPVKDVYLPKNYYTGYYSSIDLIASNDKYSPIFYCLCAMYFLNVLL